MKKVISSPDPYAVIEVALSGRDLSTVQKEAARGFLLACKIPEAGLVSSDYKGVFRVQCYIRSVKKTDAIRRRYRAGKLPLVLTIRHLGKHDWFDKWQKDYHIGPLGAKFMIVPFWEKHRFRPGRRIPVLMEPGSAFGSGYHETTRLMVKLLESLGGQVHSFLDIGCGTGILSVVASQLGVREITGYDNDRPSALVAAKNFKANQCGQGTFFCAQLKSSKLRQHFDAVGANLLSKVLLEHRAKIIARVRPGGYLLVSGIALKNFPAFKAHFSGAPLKCLKILRGRSWVAVLYRKEQAVPLK